MLRIAGQYVLGRRERSVIDGIERWREEGVVWLTSNQTMYAPSGVCLCLRSDGRRDTTAHRARLRRLARKGYLLHIEGLWKLAVLT